MNRFQSFLKLLIPRPFNLLYFHERCCVVRNICEKKKDMRRMDYSNRRYVFLCQHGGVVSGNNSHASRERSWGGRCRNYTRHERIWDKNM